MTGTAGVILAGGRSRRIGANKAEMLIAGEPLLRRVADRLAPVVDEVLVVGPQALARLVPEARVVEDMVEPTGPLGGLYTALHATAHAHIFLLACDMPFVQPGLVRAMLALAKTTPVADVIVLRSDFGIQPLHAVYARSCLPAVEQALTSDDHSLHALLGRLSFVTIGDEIVRREDLQGLSAFNANTPDDWQFAIALASSDDQQPGI